MERVRFVTAAVWIGGLIAATASVLPVFRETAESSRKMKQMMRIYWRKQRILVFVSIFILTLTGILLSRKTGATFNPITVETYRVLLNTVFGIVIIALSSALAVIA